MGSRTSPVSKPPKVSSERTATSMPWVTCLNRESKLAVMVSVST